MGEPPQGEPYLWQLGMFAASIGLPFMAVSANAPLLQAWFARSGHPDARDPYFMYAASNLGSLIALLGYPFILEPAFGLSQLSHLWAYAYGLLVLAIGASFFLMRGAQAGGVPETVAQPGAGDAASPATAPTWIDRLSWIGLAFVPAALVTAFTVHITTDVASAPLLWVIPLALYLLTFVLVFRDQPLISREALLFLHLVALVIALIALSFQTHDWFIISATGVVVFFTTAMLAHRTLYEARPAPAYLTEFYLWMSFGGALGGMFTALVAPRLFSEVYEYPLLLALSMACRPGALSFLFSRDRQKLKDEMIALWLIAAVGVLIIWWLPTLVGYVRLPLWILRVGATPMVRDGAGRHPAGERPARAAAAGGGRAHVPRARDAAVGGAAGRLADHAEELLRRLPRGGHPGRLPHAGARHDAARGAAHLRRGGQGGRGPRAHHLLLPGQPDGPHHRQAARDPAARARRATTASSGSAPAPAPATSRRARAGSSSRSTLSSSRSPATRRTSRSSSKCQPDIDIAVGDARLTIAKEPDSSFDLFIIDAFTSDAIPVHMLTKEAVQLFLDKLKPDGVVLLHTSNRYLDLNSVLGAIQKELPEGTAGIAMQDAGGEGYGESGSTVVIFAKSEGALQPYRSMEGVLDLDDGSGSGAPLRAWTDDYSDILGAFWSRFQGRG